MEFESQAIALWRRRFSETSLIVCWLTPEFGKVKTSARGALKIGGALTGRVDLFHETLIRWSEARRGDVHTLKEAEIQLPFPASASHEAFLAASYFAELVETGVEFSQPVPELFDLLRRALRFLRANAVDRRALRFFETRLAEFLGVLDAESPAEECLRKHLGKLPRLRSDLMQLLSK